MPMIGYLIDMDGTILRGGQLIPGADRFVNGLRKANIPFLLLMNESEWARRSPAARLEQTGISITEDHIFPCMITTAMLTVARVELALPTDQTVLIGGTMETMILGAQLDYKTIVVLTGETRREDAEQTAYQPDLIVDSLANLDPAALETRFGSLPPVVKPSLPHFHPSHRPRRQPAIAGTY
jgi:ribonucleotide monophosphatase NagD (HAD superfamily)